MSGFPFWETIDASKLRRQPSNWKSVDEYSAISVIRPAQPPFKFRSVPRPKTSTAARLSRGTIPRTRSAIPKSSFATNVDRFIYHDLSTSFIIIFYLGIIGIINTSTYRRLPISGRHQCRPFHLHHKMGLLGMDKKVSVFISFGLCGNTEGCYSNSMFSPSGLSVCDRVLTNV